MPVTGYLANRIHDECGSDSNTASLQKACILQMVLRDLRHLLHLYDVFCLQTRHLSLLSLLVVSPVSILARS